LGLVVEAQYHAHLLFITWAPWLKSIHRFYYFLICLVSFYFSVLIRHSAYR